MVDPQHSTFSYNNQSLRNPEFGLAENGESARKFWEIMEEKRVEGVEERVASCCSDKIKQNGAFPLKDLFIYIFCSLVLH